MPTYQYRCSECNDEFEIFQKFTDAALTTCSKCQGKLNKVYSAVGIVFKGSGFYVTDSRGKSKVSTASAKSTDSAKKPAESAKKTTDSTSKKSESKAASAKTPTSNAA